MNAGGVILIIAGAWVLCQVLGGDALGRLGITGGGLTDPGDLAGVTVPDKGYSNVPHNAQGYPL